MRSLLRRAWYVASASALLAGCGSLGPSDASPPVLDPSRAIVVFDGNSLVAGAVWPGSAADRIDLRKVQVVNVAVAGQTTAQVLDDAASQIDRMYDPSRLSIYVVWEVTNSLFHGATAEAAHDTLVALCRGRRAAGFRVVALTPLPRGQAGITADFETRRQDVLERMRSHWQSYADVLVDVAADSILGAPAALDDPQLYPDRVHLGEAGQRRVATLVADQLRAHLAPPPSAGPGSPPPAED